MKLTVQAPGGATFEVEGGTVKELYVWCAFFQSLPVVCPVDNTPTRLQYREPEGYAYYGLISSGALRFEANCGQNREGGMLFYKDLWSWWDEKAQQAHIVYENGRLTPFGAKLLDSPTDFGMADVPEINPEPDSQPRHRKPGQVEQATLNTIHALGMSLYGGKATWDSKRPGIIKAITKDRTESSGDLWQAEAATLIEKLEAKLRSLYEASAQDVMLAGGNPFELADPDSLFGVELANAYKKLMASSPQRQKNAVAALRN